MPAGRFLITVKNRSKSGRIPNISEHIAMVICSVVFSFFILFCCITSFAMYESGACASSIFLMCKFTLILYIFSED